MFKVGTIQGKFAWPLRKDDTQTLRSIKCSADILWGASLPRRCYFGGWTRISYFSRWWVPK